MVLDLILPKLSGLEVARRIQSERHVPLIMLTAKGEEEDRLLGLSVGADDYVTKPFRPRGLVARVAALLRESEVQAAPVLMDLPRIRRVLYNLISNALRHTPAGGMISLRVEPRGEEVVQVEVADTGEGIDPGDLPYVFECSFRGDRVTLSVGGT